jgi:MFS transporter, PAT family, solute carrier family 33 (acetyl-CoA transportor), member 1
MCVARRPFLLQARASYTAIGIFSLAAYPYSFKLAWSPVVDSVSTA